MHLNWWCGKIHGRLALNMLSKYLLSLIQFYTLEIASFIQSNMNVTKYLKKKKFKATKRGNLTLSSNVKGYNFSISSFINQNSSGRSLEMYNATSRYYWGTKAPKYISLFIVWNSSLSNTHFCPLDVVVGQSLEYNYLVMGGRKGRGKGWRGVVIYSPRTPNDMR